MKRKKDPLMTLESVMEEQSWRNEPIEFSTVKIYSARKKTYQSFSLLEYGHYSLFPPGSSLPVPPRDLKRRRRRAGEEYQREGEERKKRRRRNDTNGETHGSSEPRKQTH